ncbi:MAG TPA: hypothetical protein VIJ64_07505 [Candidatus Lustribacter sp.]
MVAAGRGTWDTFGMLGVILLAAVVAQPSPPPPLTTIGEAHSSTFRSAVHNDVAPAVWSLIQNKAVVDRGQDVFMAMARDRARHGAIDVEMEPVSQAIGPMVQHLGATDTALARLGADARRMHGDEEARLVAIRANLEHVADQQRNMLNVFSGSYNAYTSNELKNAAMGAQSAPEDQVTAANAVAVGAVAPIIRAASKATPAPAATAHPVAIRNVDLGLANSSAFATMYNIITGYKIDEMTLESQVSGALVQDGTGCR